LGKIQIRLGEPDEAIKTFEDAKEKANAQPESSNESEEAQKKAFVESLDLATADALVAQGSYDEAREVLSQSSAEQAPTVLTLLDENPAGYRESVLNAPIN
jgi:predicted negative regulator of RcsB-dependent stress response